MIEIRSLADRLIRKGAPYRMSRAKGVPEVSRWLRHHRDGGWRQSDDAGRDTAARRLLFLLWLISEGKCSDAVDGPTEAMIARACDIPRLRPRSCDE